jgi:hypothetical protein
MSGTHIWDYEGKNMEIFVPARVAPEMVPVYHDEATFKSNDGVTLQWLPKGRNIMAPKNQGQAYMVSGLVCPCHGIICLEYRLIKKDHYWKNLDLVNQMKTNAIKEFSKFHPNSKALFIFDNSTNHRARPPWGFDVNALSLHDSVKRVRMRDGWFTREVKGNDFSI